MLGAGKGGGGTGGGAKSNQHSRDCYQRIGAENSNFAGFGEGSLRSPPPFFMNAHNAWSVAAR